MVKFPCIYDINVCDDLGDNQYCGILYATSLSDAVAQLEQYYGSNEIYKINKIETFEYGLIEFPPSLCSFMTKVLEGNIKEGDTIV